MLLSRQLLTLCSELCQTAADAEACVAWLNHIVDVTKLGSLVGISEGLGVLVFLLGEERLHVAAFLLYLLGVLGAEHGNGA